MPLCVAIAVFVCVSTLILQISHHWTVLVSLWYHSLFCLARGKQAMSPLCVFVCVCVCVLTSYSFCTSSRGMGLLKSIVCSVCDLRIFLFSLFTLVNICFSCLLWQSQSRTFFPSQFSKLTRSFFGERVDCPIGK